MRVRRAAPEDAPALCELNRQFNGDGVAGVNHVRERLADAGVERCLVCECDGRIAGFICALCFSSLCYIDPVAEITELYVCPDFRRKGTGRMLVEAMVRQLRSECAAEIRLLTGRANSPARALYEACGFRQKDECCYKYEDN